MRDLIDAVAAEPDTPLLATPGSIRLRDVKGLIGKCVRDPRSLFLVAEAAGRLAGNLGGSGLAFAPSAHVFEFGMSVGADYRGIGVGSALLEAALAWAASVGYVKVVLSAFPHNKRAIIFYERHGFTLEGCRARQFLRDGRYLDELIMGRLIATAAVEQAPAEALAVPGAPAAAAATTAPAAPAATTAPAARGASGAVVLPTPVRPSPARSDEA
ncbi:MAG: N-acetyltransferase family protein [Thermoleophilia bacterium]